MTALLQGFSPLETRPSQSALPQSSAKKQELAATIESFFYQLLLKEMRENSEDPLFDSSALESWQEMQDGELAMHLGRQGHLGISQLVLKETERLEKQAGLGLLK